MTAATQRITNPKIATLEPRWRRYRGMSVLFDNPGARIEPGVSSLADMPVDDAEQQRLYDELAEVVADVDPDGMRDGYGFCPLPRNTYHVTVCEGPNERNVVNVPSPYRKAVATVLDGLPEGLDRVPATLGFLSGASLLAAVAANPVTLRVAGIVVWGHVLAARLEPVDAAARDRLDQVTRARADLADQIWSRMRLRTQPWQPHVSLGYFPNRGAAQAATPTLARWNCSLAARPQSTITFGSAAVYGFTDMVSFFRLSA